jgi:hypothetical protein
MSPHDDLSTLIREHVDRDEPVPLLPGPTVQAGRRRLRTRRLTEAAAVAAVLVVAGASAVTWFDGGGSGGAGPDRGMDPASAAALEDYDVHRMPALMDEHVRGVLRQSVPGLGESRFAAYDDQGTSLPERYWDKASSLEVAYAAGEHDYAVRISHSRGEAEGDPEAYCRSGLDEGLYLECTVSRTDDGDVVISKLEATKPMPGAGKLRMIVQREELDTVALDRLSFSRTVKVIKSATLITYVSESLTATDRDPAAAPFTTSYADLASIGADPELVMPVPPPGENGCPAWSMPQKGTTISCGTTR